MAGKSTLLAKKMLDKIGISVLLPMDLEVSGFL
jgi:hypothetical protein